MKFIFLVKEFLLIFTVAVLLSLNSCNRAYAASNDNHIYVDEIQKESEYKYFVCIQNEDSTCSIYRFKTREMLWKNRDNNAVTYTEYKRADFDNIEEMKKAIKAQNIAYEKATANLTLSTETQRTLCSNFTIKTDDDTIEIKAHNYKNGEWTAYNDGEFLGMTVEDLYNNTVEQIAVPCTVILAVVYVIISFRKVVSYVENEVKKI